MVHSFTLAQRLHYIKRKTISSLTFMETRKLNANAANILKMLTQKDPVEFWYWLDVILDDLASTIDNRAVCEFIYKLEDGTFLASTCYVTPPRVGEFIDLNKEEYEIVKVKHAFNVSVEAGTIIVRPVNKWID